MTTVQRTGTGGPGIAKPANDIEPEAATSTNVAIPSVWNVPNCLTTIRFFLAIAVVVMVDRSMYYSAMITFLIAASTDWMDGYYARKYGQVTKFGRIFDPFVDKIIICGAFIALVSVEKAQVPAWMAIVVVARELLVTSLRGIIEGSGINFSASLLGKWKMVFQCVAVVAVLMCLVVASPSAALQWIRVSSLWVAMGLTVYSGIDYVIAATRVLGANEGTA